MQFADVHIDAEATAEITHAWLKFIHTAHTEPGQNLQQQTAEDLPTSGRTAEGGDQGASCSEARGTRGHPLVGDQTVLTGHLSPEEFLSACGWGAVVRKP